MPNYQNIREEELKIKVGNDYFSGFDNSRIIGNIDFCVAIKTDKNQDSLLPVRSFLWAEAKKGKSNIYTSFIQLILTIGKARTFAKESPPSYLGAFDAHQMAFIRFYEFKDIFDQNDFNWNVTSSNYETKEFKQIYAKVEQILTSKSLIFSYETDDKGLRHFIKNNFTNANGQTSKIPIDRNNFNYDVYEKWRILVKPSIGINWESAKKAGIIDGDFYLADLLSSNNQALKERLHVSLKGDYYQVDRKKLIQTGMFSSQTAYFNDNQKAHNQFWNRYERPQREEFWDFMINHKHLLVPQDVRERKGSFFTPPQWVIKSQKYLADILGENWQDEYYIWDCAAGTGNLLAGLVDKYKIYASTLDESDVSAMRVRIDTMNQNSIKGNGANLLDSHVFQFDFLNDSFEDEKVPQSLREILKNPEKRKKLVIYINPPYAEAATADRKGNKIKVSSHKVKDEYFSKIGNAVNELFAQFFIRIEKEISGCYLSSFSKMKYIQGPNFVKFRGHFLAEFKKGFVVPADTFDNVKGKFPIGFLIWDTGKKEKINRALVEVFDKNGLFLGEKSFVSVDKNFINNWYSKFYDNLDDQIGVMNTRGNDFQNQNYIYISSDNNLNHTNIITKNNLIPTSIYLTVRHCFKAAWLNDRDQFLLPNDCWKTDTEFQNDCLAFSLFHGQNRISSKQGINHWIPFTENEVNAPERFESHFMMDFVNGKLYPQLSAKVDPLKGVSGGELFEETKPSFIPTRALQFSPEAKAVFEAGLELWRYYHKEPNCNVNAGLYDIREYFQGRNEKTENARMNNKSGDKKYNLLINNLRNSLDNLGKKIQPKVYEFGFLRG